MAKLFQPIRFWMARFTCRKSSASSSSSCPSRPSSGLQPATIRWRAFVRRPSGRPASTKRTSATVARRSPVSYAPRPRSRLGIPARLSRSGGRRRFALASPGFTHARGTGETPQSTCRLPGSQPLLACARDSLCLPPVVPYRIRRGYYRPTLLPCPLASTGPAAFLAEPDHASFFAGNCHCQGKQSPPVRRPVSVAAGGNPPGKRFLPIRWPIR